MHQDNEGTIWLELAGDLRGIAVEQLRSAVVRTVETERPDRLLVGLDAVFGIDEAAVTALMSGYLAAIDYGTSYQVSGARDHVHRFLQATRTLEVLANSDDLQALLEAVLRSPTRKLSR